MEPTKNPHPGQDPGLPDEARAALGRAGQQLLAQLASMRESESVIGQSRPLDPQAAGILRRRGDTFLADLAARRVEEGWSLPRRRQRGQWGQWGAVAAAIIGVAGVAWTAGQALGPVAPVAPAAPATAASPVVTAVPLRVSVDLFPAASPFESEPLAVDSIPEPDSALLVFAGAAVLLARRRRSGVAA
ncbi:hypothetical protein BH23VER1_BH23VER1_09940 [soil metagenome]